jgi:outer membrane lipoprotein SlyB
MGAVARLIRPTKQFRFAIIRRRERVCAAAGLREGDSMRMMFFVKKHGGRYAQLLLASVLAVGITLSGCASRGGKTYSDGDVRQIQSVQYGTVLDVTEVMVEEDPSIVGPAVGGVAGGILGSLFGAGTGRTLMALGGAALGAAAGGAGEYAMRRYKANQITMELERGGTSVVVQGNDEYFVKGDRVRIIHTGEGHARVQHI